MIETITRSGSRTLLPVLCTIAGLAAVGVAGIVIRAGTESATPAVPRVMETMMVAAPMPVPAVSERVVHVHQRTQDGGASGVFSPSRAVVRRGDVLRFETDGLAAHNVSFSRAENEGIPMLPPSGPYLTSPGQSHDMRIDLEPGVYHFQCDPHASMGEHGVLVVREADAPGPVRRETR